MILLLAGTSDARLILQRLKENHAKVAVSVTTEYGAALLHEAADLVNQNRLDACGLQQLFDDWDISLVVDATHPYAVEATRNIRAACKTAGTEYRRLLRPESPLPAGSMVFASAAHAAGCLARTQGNVLLATGAKELSAFAVLEPARLFPRVLPTREGIAACEGADIPHKNIIAMQGPFSYALNRALMEQFAIRFLVTKDGGAAGGFAEKARAAQDTGAQLIVIRRPAEQGETAEQILTHCKEMLQ